MNCAGPSASSTSYIFEHKNPVRRLGSEKQALCKTLYNAIQKHYHYHQHRNQAAYVEQSACLDALLSVKKSKEGNSVLTGSIRGRKQRLRCGIQNVGTGFDLCFPSLVVFPNKKVQLHAAKAETLKNLYRNQNACSVGRC